MAEVQQTSTVTMEMFRQSCSDELDAAIQRGDAVIRPDWSSYETSAGLEITRFLGHSLYVECDIDELDDEAQRVVRFDWSTNPPTVTENTDTADSHWSDTIPVREHDELAGRFIKYVTLLVD